ncbi:hypothetical protein DXH95_02925 [Sphingorhabdus pulchriflava]|uniref:Uncharacterized protein n=1 Tax=Sphingorhabdus pulchriflava TaxID=2292257 RepID=A0A371BFN5_9SPHN|nr:hypothetical protein [Sphingorhabdus pulchriflava]RDV06394.1 hypothetical protein DXH95_02925 [Sphingorhabdus pulchriflava]
MTDDNPPPPRRLSNKIGHRDFHPSYGRVGLRFDGQERTDVRYYNMDAGTPSKHSNGGMIETTSGEMLFGNVEPYWRYAESRQQRHARERWEAKHQPKAGGTA